MMVANTAPKLSSTGYMHMVLGLASIMPQLAVRNIETMHSIGLSMLGAIWVHAEE
jgi:hypothetical protein